MKINTRKFGEINIEENKILSMPKGLPGFPGYEKFALIDDPKTAPFCWFQSVEEPNLALVVMNPFLFKPDYQVDLKTLAEEMAWQGVEEKDMALYVVVNIIKGEKEKRITANLMGPLVINVLTKEVVQAVISDSRYSHQHNVLEHAAG